MTTIGKLRIRARCAHCDALIDADGNVHDPEGVGEEILKAIGFVGACSQCGKKPQ